MFRRLMRALGAIFAALFVFLAMPAGLYFFGPNPWPAFVAFANDPMMRDDGSLLLAVITVIGWVSWAYFILGLLIEIVGRMFGRSPRVPGLGPAQMLAGLILAAITTTTVVSTIANSRAAATSHTVPSPPAVVASVLLTEPSDATEIATAPVVQEKYVTHVVQRGETVLDLAERYYHHSDAFTRILDANIGLPQPGGKALQANEIKVLPGWTLRIPSPEIDPATSISASGPLKLAAETSVSTVYQIERGDYLRSIAERFLGDGERYTEIAECNPDLIADPDLILPGWQLTLPADAHDSGPRAHATGDTITPPSENDNPAVTVPPVTAQPSPTEAATPKVPPMSEVTPQAQAPSIAGPAAGHEQGATDDPTTDAADDTDETAGHPAITHVSLPSGGWITAGLATAIATALVIARLQRRRNNKPEFPIRISNLPDSTATPIGLRSAATAGLTILDGRLDELHHIAPADVPGTLSAVALDRTTTEVSLHQHLTGRLGVRGAGRHGAARAIIAAAVTSSALYEGAGQAELLTDQETLLGLLDGESSPNEVPRLTIASDLETAVGELEREVVYRSRHLASYDAESIDELNQSADSDPLDLFIWLTAADQRYEARIAAATAQAPRLGIVAIQLDAANNMIPTVTVEADGTVHEEPGQATHPLLCDARMATLSSGDLTDVLTLLTATTEPPAITEDALKTPVDADQRDPAALAEQLELADELAPQRTGHPPVTLRLLGVPSLSTQSGPITKGFRSDIFPILAYLAGHPHGRTLKQIWHDVLPDQSEASAKADIRAAMTRMRTTVRKAADRDGAYLLYENEHYRIDPNLIEVDVWRMNAHIATANNATDEQSKLDALLAATACYQGEFAANVDLWWANDQRPAYHKQAVDCYAHIAEIHESAKPDSALAALNSAIEIDGMNEFLHQTVMRIQARLGRLDAVKRTMDDLRHRLAGINSEPSEATQRVYRRAVDPSANRLPHNSADRTSKPLSISR